MELKNLNSSSCRTCRISTFRIFNSCRIIMRQRYCESFLYCCMNLFTRWLGHEREYYYEFEFTTILKLFSAYNVTSKYCITNHCGWFGSKLDVLNMTFGFDFDLKFSIEQVISHKSLSKLVLLSKN